ncbi:hypothetical protein [Sphingomonas sp.]|uniref:hypothetical protein n=1 Tax=Sphingomonas sp. TaxID=28214 RepID=UPI0035C8086B
MINITDFKSLARVLDSPVDAAVKTLLLRRRDQLLADTGDEYDLGELVHFIVVDPGDTVACIEHAAGYPLVTASAFEWVAAHGGWYEAVTILSDDGFGVVLLVPDCDGAAPELLLLLRQAAQGHTIAP